LITFIASLLTQEILPKYNLQKILLEEKKHGKGKGNGVAELVARSSVSSWILGSESMAGNII
jgi:hypothetical protein